MKTITLIIRIILGLVFIAASAEKILHPAEFAKIIYNYQLLPDMAINIVALILPWLELAIGLLLLSGLWTPGASLIATLLMAFFLGAQAFNLARGLNIHCGCFSLKQDGDALPWLSILRDTGILLMSAFLAIRVFCRKNG